MASPGRVGELEIEQDLDHQRRAWAFERISWGVLALTLLAALLGLLGPGPLSDARAGEQQGPLWLEHSRFGRYRAPTTLRAHLGPGAVSEGEVRLWLSDAYLREVEIQRITPEPDRTELAPGGLVYVFSTAGADQPGAITFHLQPDRIGPLGGEFRLGTGTVLTFDQFIYP